MGLAEQVGVVCRVLGVVYCIEGGAWLEGVVCGCSGEAGLRRGLLHGAWSVAMVGGAWLEGRGL